MWPNPRVIGSALPKRTRFFSALLLCLAACCTLAEEVYDVMFELTVSPFDGSDPVTSGALDTRIPISRPFSNVSIGVGCPARYACSIAIAQVSGQQGKLGISVTEYDSPDTPTRIVFEIDTTADFTIGELVSFESKTVHDLFRLDFIVEPGSEQSIQALMSRTSDNELKHIIRAVEHSWGGEFIGARLYPGTNRQKFYELGLVPGDVAVQFNGRNADNESFVTLLRDAIRAGIVESLVVQRHDELVKFTIQ